LFRGCIKAGGTPTSCSDDANAHPERAFMRGIGASTVKRAKSTSE
jgi:hypothetical protein